MPKEIELNPNHLILKIPPSEQVKTHGRVHGIISHYVEEKYLVGELDDVKLMDLKVDALDLLGVTCALAALIRDDVVAGGHQSLAAAGG